jgi:hypothetical protein
MEGHNEHGDVCRRLPPAILDLSALIVEDVHGLRAEQPENTTDELGGRVLAVDTYRTS